MYYSWKPYIRLYDARPSHFVRGALGTTDIAIINTDFTGIKTFDVVPGRKATCITTTISSYVRGGARLLMIYYKSTVTLESRVYTRPATFSSSAYESTF